MPYSYKDIEKRFILLGYKIVRQNGSNVLSSNGKTTFPVPKHGKKDISSGVENKIIKVLGLEKENFKNYCG